MSRNTLRPPHHLCRCSGKVQGKDETDLLTHPLAPQLQSCNSSSDILASLHDKVNEFNQSRSHNERLLSWLNLTINILYVFSATLDQGIGLIFSPANVVISASFGVLFLAAKGVDARVLDVGSPLDVDERNLGTTLFSKMPTRCLPRPSTSLHPSVMGCDISSTQTCRTFQHGSGCLDETQKREYQAAPLYYVAIVAWCYSECAG